MILEGPNQIGQPSNLARSGQTTIPSRINQQSMSLDIELDGRNRVVSGQCLADTVQQVLILGKDSTM
ncbi:hypothetical protein [Candidatus Entotheonella palauensis]|uniref:hypothetical protein n=1 Tax=Candidatus Entotheonella palauensis TaxID=93172 RepID=UPI000B7CEEDA|nr:hypothetical protein [Candidatus Entotheonella palauensis]